MAIRFITATSVSPRADGFAVTVTGGTIDGASGTVELAFDDAVFTVAEGKTRLILAVEELLDYLKETARPWPLA